MRTKVWISALAMLVCGVLVPALAHAEVFLSPFIGTSFGQDAKVHKPALGASITLVGHKLSLELEYGRINDFFGAAQPGTNVSNLSISAVGGANLHAKGVKPYFLVGAGILRTDTTGVGLLQNAHYNDFAIHIGGGVNALFTDHFGIRGEVRYLRRLERASEMGVLPIVSNFDFFRAILGFDAHF